MPVPLGPKIRMLAPCSIQASPSARAITCALRMVGTAAKSKVAKRLAGRQAGLGQMTGDPARRPLGQLMLAQRGEKAGAAPALAVGAAAELLPDAGRSSAGAASVSITGSLAASTSIMRRSPRIGVEQAVVDRRGRGPAR